MSRDDGPSDPQQAPQRRDAVPQAAGRVHRPAACRASSASTPPEEGRGARPRTTCRMTHLTDEEQAGSPGHPRPLRAHQGPGLQAEGGPGSTGPGDRLHAPEPALRLQDDGGAGGLRRRAEVPGGGQPGREVEGVQFYLADHPEDEQLFNTGHQDVAYRHFLNWLGGTLSRGDRRPVQPDRPGQPALPAAAGAGRGARPAQQRGTRRGSGPRTRRSAGSTSISRPRNCGTRPARRARPPATPTNWPSATSSSRPATWSSS